MRISVLTLFPQMFKSMLDYSILKRANEQDLFSFEAIDFRPFTEEKHGHVDDTPYGGGAGMVLKCQPILDCLKAIKTKQSTVILLTPQGQPFKQATAAQLSLKKHLIFICGHYEGFDERIRQYVDLQLSLGDFVLTGGEMAAMVMSEAIVRLIDGTIEQASHADDSFSDGLLEYPQYTRPVEYEGLKVPEVLLSGHHAKIAAWRRQQQLERTLALRPDLLEKAQLSEKERIWIEKQLKDRYNN